MTSLRSVSLVIRRYRQHHRAMACPARSEHVFSYQIPCRTAGIFRSAAMNLHDIVTPRSVSSSHGPMTTQPDSAKVGSRCDDLRIVVAQTSPHRVDTVKSLAIKSAGRDNFVITQMLRKSPGHGLTEAQA